jgi:hypothetical protein
MIDIEAKYLKEITCSYKKRIATIYALCLQSVLTDNLYYRTMISKDFSRVQKGFYQVIDLSNCLN